MKRMNRKGQGSFLSGDVPSIIMIVLSIGFFLSATYISIDTVDSKKRNLDMESALVDASSIFLKENSKIKASDLSEYSTGYTAVSIQAIERKYGIKTYVELLSLSDDPNSPCRSQGECVYGTEPTANFDQHSKRFPIALKGGGTDLDVYPALIRVSLYTPR